MKTFTAVVEVRARIPVTVGALNGAAALAKLDEECAEGLWSYVEFAQKTGRFSYTVSEVRLVKEPPKPTLRQAAKILKNPPSFVGHTNPEPGLHDLPPRPQPEDDEHRCPECGRKDDE